MSVAQTSPYLDRAHLDKRQQNNSMKLFGSAKRVAPVLAKNKIKCDIDRFTNISASPTPPDFALL